MERKATEITLKLGEMKIIDEFKVVRDGMTFIIDGSDFILQSTTEDDEKFSLVFVCINAQSKCFHNEDPSHVTNRHLEAVFVIGVNKATHNLAKVSITMMDFAKDGEKGFNDILRNITVDDIKVVNLNIPQVFTD